MTRIAHSTAIIIFVLAPLASVIGWFAVIAISLVAVMATMLTAIDDVVAWLDGLEAEGL